MIVLNDLYDYNLKIYQDSTKFKFSLDSLLLSEFVDINKNDRNLLDLCSGNAPLPLILAKKNHNLHITGIEIQKEIYDLAIKSIEYNNLNSRINMHNINAKEAPKYFPCATFDIITCNPPFFKVTSSSHINESPSLAIARHELTITLEDIITTSSYLLKNNGRFYLVHRPERLEEILILANQVNLHVKRIEFIFTKAEECAIMVLLKFVKNSNIGVKIGTKIINRDTKTYQNIFTK